MVWPAAQVVTAGMDANTAKLDSSVQSQHLCLRLSAVMQTHSKHTCCTPVYSLVLSLVQLICMFSRPPALIKLLQQIHCLSFSTDKHPCLSRRCRHASVAHTQSNW